MSNTTTTTEVGTVKVASKYPTKKINRDVYKYRGWLIRKFNNDYLLDPEIRGVQWNTYRNYDAMSTGSSTDIADTLRDAKMYIDICVERDLISAHHSNPQPERPTNMDNTNTNTEATPVKVVGKTIYDNMDSRNRQFLWNLFEDGSAMTREITHHTGDPARPSKETYREIHKAESEMARLIARMMQEVK